MNTVQEIKKILIMKVKNIKFLFVATIGIFSIPFIVSAQITDYKSFVDTVISKMLKPIIPFVVALTVTCFLWGTAKYIMYADEATKREEGRKMMLISIISLAVITSFWGLAKILVNTFGF